MNIEIDKLTLEQCNDYLVRYKQSITEPSMLRDTTTYNPETLALIVNRKLNLIATSIWEHFRIWSR